MSNDENNKSSRNFTNVLFILTGWSGKERRSSRVKNYSFNNFQDYFRKILKSNNKSCFVFLDIKHFLSIISKTLLVSNAHREYIPGV